ncbi:MAG: hypothetical protein JNN03_07725 [Rubrivivax sp.]|nr:hypothetical protein [Rubrivivax sp.]
MTKAAFSVRAFGYYMLVLGVVLVLAPNQLLGLSFMPPTNEVWIRVAGVLVLNIGVYYIYAAKCEATDFFAASVYTRILVFVAFAAFAALGLAKPMLVLFGAVDLLGGLWTLRALKSAA